MREPAVGLLDVLDPLRVVVVAGEADAGFEPHRAARPPRHLGLGVELLEPWPSPPIEAVVAGEHRLAVVELEVMPQADVGGCHAPPGRRGSARSRTPPALTFTPKPLRQLFCHDQCMLTLPPL